MRWANSVWKNAARGAAIGAANTVPGVSGGTIAVITGIYDDLITAISHFFSRRWKEHLFFLVPVVFGAGLGIALFARFIEFGLERFPEQTAFVFIGLIVGSVPFVYRQTRSDRLRPRYVGAALVAAALLVVQGFLHGEPGFGTAIAEVSLSTVVPLLLAGIIAAATMIIPGVSGSFVLVLIGMYTTFLQAVRTVNLPVLAILVTGAAIGIVGVARIMDLLLRRFHVLTYWIILGLVVGSIAGIWPGVTGFIPALFDTVAAGVGIGAALLLGKKPSAG